MVVPCGCTRSHVRRRVVLTGGPGAGKTALLELVRQALCPHVRVLPESAGIVFGGGFPRSADRTCRRASQRAIFHVQRELEVVGDVGDAALVLCDRGTVDGVVYWPGSPEEFWASFGTDRDTELARYDAVIHLRTPGEHEGYNHVNPLRTEDARAAAAIDARLLDAWAGHPHRVVIPSEHTFLEKAGHALEVLRAQLPDCCTPAPAPGGPSRVLLH
jgi:hypothetical protein